MSEEKKNEEPFSEELPEAVVVESRRRQLSIVWIVPLVALLIGAWLVYKAISEKGPTITITFNTAEGLEAGKTKIKYKDVELGQVSEIRVSPDLSHVVVTAELVKQAEKFLSKNTRFWVVRARVAAGEISGLGTLFSGAYIGVDPGKSGKPARRFKGLEIPPVVTTDLPGAHFILLASRLGSLDIGSPVYYRQIKVGQVVGYQLDEDGQAVTVKVFIHAPHHRLVHKNTRFYNASGLDVSVDASGIKVNAESLATLMIGGIAFDTPVSLEPSGPAEEGQVFKLYENRESTFEKTYARKSNWLLHFNGSVRGLAVGAPVEFRGIRIGKVLDVNLEYEMDKNTIRIPVLIEIEPDRIGTNSKIPWGTERRRIMDDLVEKGLRAQLKTGNLITGQLLVDLDMHPEAPAVRINWEGKYPELPTIPAPIDEITASLTQLLQKLGKVPIEQIGSNLNETVQGANRLVNASQLRETVAALNETLKQVQQLVAQMNTTMAPELQQAATRLNATLKQTQILSEKFNAKVAPQIGSTLVQAQQTLADIGNTVGTDSALNRELKRVLAELSQAVRSIRVMADYLERHPDALIYGKGKEQ
jgi:paraquat-inducible protein B